MKYNFEDKNGSIVQLTHEELVSMDLLQRRLWPADYEALQKLWELRNAETQELKAATATQGG